MSQASRLSKAIAGRNPEPIEFKPRIITRIPLQPICDQVWEDAKRLALEQRDRNVSKVLANRYSMSESQVVRILMAYGIALERVARNLSFGVREAMSMAQEAADEVWAEMREAS